MGFFAETATTKLESQTDGVLQEPFDSTSVFVRQSTVAFHPACQPWHTDKWRTVVAALVY